VILERAMGIEPTSEPWEPLNVMPCPPASGVGRLHPPYLFHLFKFSLTLRYGSGILRFMTPRT